VPPGGACSPRACRIGDHPCHGAGLSTLEGAGCYLTRLDPRAAWTCACRDRADTPGLESLARHGSRVTTTVLPCAPCRSSWNSRGTRGRTRSARGSIDTSRDHWRTLVRARAVSAQRRTPVTTEFSQSG